MSSNDKDPGKGEERPRQRKITASAVNVPPLRVISGTRPVAKPGKADTPRKPSR